MVSNQTRVTKSGVVAFRDNAFGLVAYSPYTGLLYAVHSTIAENILLWLDGKLEKPHCDRSLKTLGNGWAIENNSALYPIPQLLPNLESWDSVPIPSRPLLINWLITGRCPLACRYCYAEDLMRNEELEPSQEAIIQIGNRILSHGPAAVVITGGDPLFSPRLVDAVAVLSGKTGIIVDTSGYTLTSEHITLFAKHKVAVRVSVDSTIPRIHGAQRPTSNLYPGFVKKGGSLESALSAIERLMNHGITTSVQTVATKKTANDLIALGDVLLKLGIRSWRIFKVAPSVARFDEWKTLVGSHSDSGAKYSGKQARGPYDHAFREVIKASSSVWGNQMIVQVTTGDSPNSVVLVAPDGRFMTESNTGHGKLVIDPNRPKAPRSSEISKSIDLAGHVARYLNLTSAAFNKNGQ